MDYPVDTPSQLRGVLRALRRARGLTQTELGRWLGVSQKRIAQIEAAPELASFNQISRLISILSGRLVVQDLPTTEPPTEQGAARRQAPEGW
jgi:HTH-type transcriptional regulator/antitoxin HipB